MKIYENKYLVVGFAIVLSLLSTEFVLAQYETYGPSANKTSTLTLSLQQSLDPEDGNIRLMILTKAELLSTDGSVVKTASIENNVAKFDLVGLNPGDYFIRVNDMSEDLIPTKIDDATKSTNQFVGEKLKISVIGSISDPIYKIETFSKGQKDHPVVKYSDGTNVIPEKYAYVILSLKTDPQRQDIKVLGTGEELSNYTPTTKNHPNTNTSFGKSFSEWIIPGHCDDYGGNDNKCNVCHGNLGDLDKKPELYEDIKNNYGFCYTCHYGKGGFSSGFIDSVNIIPNKTTTTPIATTAVPTMTQKAPALEMILGITVLIITYLTRKYKK